MKQAHTLLLFVLVMCSIPTGLAAQKCKYALDETDAMTGNKVRRTSVRLESYFMISFYKNADDHRVELNVRFVGERNFEVPEGNELQIKLANGEIFTVLSAQSASPVSYVASTQVMTDYALSYRCSVEDMKRIASVGVAVARVKLGDETITYEVKKNDVIETASKATCLLAE
ncbi:MAG: hypothetical protein KA175_03200 [Flavobacteriales bacterium]|nr:hypothetical protein [Flavobacteriales bacterium]MBP6696599.1 hypothetical protein [Flavobacteriales bacterium]